LLTFNKLYQNYYGVHKQNSAFPHPCPFPAGRGLYIPSLEGRGKGEGVKICVPPYGLISKKEDKIFGS